MNLGALEAAIEAGRLDAGAADRRGALRAAGLVRGSKLAGVRLLANGEISRAVTITVSGASAAAMAAVQAAGGTVTTRWRRPSRRLEAAAEALMLAARRGGRFLAPGLAAAAPRPAGSLRVEWRRSREEGRSMASAAEQLAANLNLGVLSKATELKKRLWFTLGALIVYRIGTYVPVPGVDAGVMGEMLRQHGGGILGMFDMFTGGALRAHDGVRAEHHALHLAPASSSS